MRKKTLFLALAAFVANIPMLFADSLNEEQARIAVASYFNPKEQASRLRVKGQQLKLRSESHKDGYYIFDRPEGGCVFVADDDAVGRTVLGYTDQGCYDGEDLPVGLQDWLKQIGVLMNAVHEGKINRNVVHRSIGKTVVDKLINTTWNQYEPYNNLCPSVGLNKCITGCVATAMAQVMKYWEWPEHGYDSISYYDEGCGQTLSRNFTLSKYKWKDMLNNYTGVPYRKENSNAVAVLMRDCGYAVQMYYTPEASSANVSAEEMATYFHYNEAAIDRYSGDYPEEAWHALIQQDLLAQRPVLYSGQSTTDGHEFILDGFDTANYYHVNWGWGGHQDGWFTLTNLNGFNDTQYMINELEPDYNEGEKDFSYNLSDDGVLTINGTGVMPKEYAMNKAPWAEQCESVRKIIFGEGITTIVDGFGYARKDNDAYYFTNLEEVVLPEGLKYIGNYAFFYTQLSSISLPSTLVEACYSFYGANIETMHLPKGIISFDEYLPSLKELTVDDQNPWLSARDNLLYDKSGKSLFYIPSGLERVTLAETTERINNSKLFRMKVPIICKPTKAPSVPEYILDNVSDYTNKTGTLFVPYGADYDSWKEYLLPGWNFFTYYDIDLIPDMAVNWTLNKGVLTISGWGVQNDNIYGYTAAPYYEQGDQVQKLYVREGITKLAWAGYYCYHNMTEIVLPSTLSEIGEYCFTYTNLQTITCYAMKAPAIYSNNVFGAIPENGTLRIPVGADYDSYVSTWPLPQGWKIEYFNPEPMATCHLANGEVREIADLTEWDALLEVQPNAVGVMNPQYANWAYLTQNMLFEDEVQQRKYLCPYLRLSDAEDFAAPASFIAIKGTYSRKLQAGYNTACLPFGINQNNLPQGCRMYAYSHYDTSKGEAILYPISSTSPGQACLIYSNAEVDWRINLTDQKAVGQPQNAEEDNLYGSFVATNAYMGTAYVPSANGTTLVPLSEQLNPLRACILIDNAPAEIKIRIADKDETDAINSIMVDSPAAKYTLDGKRIYAPRKGQTYIMNGKKIISDNH